MLGTVPVEALDLDENDSLYDVGLVRRAEGFDEGGRFIIVLVDLDSSENFEAGLVGVVHEEEGYAIVMLEVAEADVLLVAAEVCETDEAWVDDVDEAFVTASVLDVGPAGLADGGHVEAVAGLNEGLFR